MSTSNVRAYTEEELFELEKAKKKTQAKVIPMNSPQDLVPTPALNAVPLAIANNPSWFKRNQTLLIFIGVTLAITGIIIYIEYQNEKKRKLMLQ